MSTHETFQAVVALAALCCSTAVFAQEAAIRKALAERMPQLGPIDEVRRTPLAGLWEVRYSGTELLYSDAKGEFIVVGGAMVDAKTNTDLTQARLDKLLAIAFDKLPLKDAVVVKQGSGARRLAVFADPNCGYCKRLERDLTQIKDVTIYTFVLPILGAESNDKSRDIWCAKDGQQASRNWMLNGSTPPKAAVTCNTAALSRNLMFAQAHKINGTPAVIFEDGTRKPGAMPGDQIEQMLAEAAGRK